MSNPPASPDAAGAAGGASPPSLGQLSAQVQALRGVVQSQHNQLQALQQQEQARPLVGWTTDSPWGMALEGLLLGAVALGLGAASMWGFRATPQRGLGKASPRQAPITAPPAFSDSLLYLADQEEEQGTPVAMSARLHDPRYDSRGKVFSQDDDDVELDYYRMALTQQGLSVTAGAGQVDSDRIPLSAMPPERPAHVDEGVPSAFAQPPSVTDFDQRAAAEEVERVRNYLAQRRADRVKSKDIRPEAEPIPVAEAGPQQVPTQPGFGGRDLDGGQAQLRAAEATPALEWESLVQGAQEPARAVEPSPSPPIATPDTEVLEHTGLDEGASLLAALSQDESAAESAVADAHQKVAEPSAADSHLLEWDAPALPVAQAEELGEPGEPIAEDTGDALEDRLPSASVQLQLALEFRDLGLWEEARERVLEVLAQPDDGHHAQAQALLDELAQTAPVPLGVEPQIVDPWSTLGSN